MLGDVGWEHKLISDDLEQQIDLLNLEPHYVWQLEHQALVTGAERILFMASDGTEERCVSMWYTPHHPDEVINGWHQFVDDLANYQPRQEKSEPTGKSPEDLPALRIELTGEVTDTNLEHFREHALAILDGINTELQTDEDFASAEKTTKWAKEVEKRLDAAKEHALSQTDSIDRLFRTIDEIREQARQTRLDLEKKVEARKKSIRHEIAQEAKNALDEHIKGLEQPLENQGVKTGVINDLVSADFAAAMKGKKTVRSLRDAVDERLAQAKIEANEWADRIRANLHTFAAEADGYETLFPDQDRLVQKSPEDMVATVKARIAEHEAEQKRRKEQNERAAAAEAPPEPQQTAAQPVQYPEPEEGPQLSEPADDGARLKLSDINARIAPLSISAEGLSQLGFDPVGRQKAAKLYRACDFPAICRVLMQHLESARCTKKEAA
jgi:hypothetical protein